MMMHDTQSCARTQSAKIRITSKTTPCNRTALMRDPCNIHAADWSVVRRCASISPLLCPSHSCITTPATQAFSRNNRHHGKHLSRTCALPMERPHEREEARDRILRARSTPKIIPWPPRNAHESHDMRSIRIRQSRARHSPNRQRQPGRHASV